MAPQTILRQIARVRARERAVGLASGTCRWLALAGAALLVACLADWLIDLRAETPRALRVGMLAAQGILWAAAAGILLARPLFRRRSDDEAALWIEEHFPALDHRLITAVQLNRPGTDLGGMSPALVAAVTAQAEERAAVEDFSAKVDWSPVKRAAPVLVGILALGAVLGAASPETAGALLARQLLADREIPRSVALESEFARRVRPGGEEVVLRFRARGKVDFERLGGEVRVHPTGRSAEEYPLVFSARVGPEEAWFAATVAPSDVDFDFGARLRDGRTRRPARIVFEARPVVTRIEAALVLPAWCGVRPDGTRYEQERPRAEIAGPLGSSARVRIAAQKPLARAELELLGRPPAEGAPEPVTRRVPLAIRPGALGAEGVFDLRPDETAYRVAVEDPNGFANLHPPKRSVTVVPDEPPRVVLLPERFMMPGEEAFSDEYEVEGMPVPVGGAVRVAYYAAHPYGLSGARLAWRVIPAGRAAQNGGGATPEAPWRRFPLKEIKATAETGPFELKLGLFRKSGPGAQVEFHPVLSPDPNLAPGRLEGGGSFDFQTKPLAGLKPGDQIEYYVEVAGLNPALADKPGRSEMRAKLVVTPKDFVEWIAETLKHEQRIRQIETRQRGVFTPEGTER